MMEESSQLDEEDIAFIRTLIPKEHREQAIPVGMFTVVQWIDPDTGASKWRRWSPFDAPVSQAAGLAFMGILEMLGKSNADITFPSDEE